MATRLRSRPREPRRLMTGFGATSPSGHVPRGRGARRHGQKRPTRPGLATGAGAAAASAGGAPPIRAVAGWGRGGGAPSAAPCRRAARLPRRGRDDRASTPRASRPADRRLAPRLAAPRAVSRDEGQGARPAAPRRRIAVRRLPGRWPARAAGTRPRAATTPRRRRGRPPAPDAGQRRPPAPSEPPRRWGATGHTEAAAAAMASPSARVGRGGR